MEFRFELALCAALESPDRVVARQLGAGVETPGTRIVDVCLLSPGTGFDDRAAIAAERIPDPAIEAAVGPGEAVPVAEAFDLPPDRAAAVVERAVEVGYLERERRDGRPVVRATARYPDDWVGGLVAVENKPDLDRPGARALRLLDPDTVAVLLHGDITDTGNQLEVLGTQELPVLIAEFHDGLRPGLTDPIKLLREFLGGRSVDIHRLTTDNRMGKKQDQGCSQSLDGIHAHGFPLSSEI
jgi:hypothetical protein